MPKEAKSSGIDQKVNLLLERLKSYGKVIVAFSGGVDSTLLAEVAHRALGRNALAVTAISDSYPEREMKAAQEIAKQIGIRFETIQTEELEMEGYTNNPTNRCYFCKTELFNKLRPIAENYQIGTIVYGAIPDDVGDYRPGMDAAKQMGVQAPLIDVDLTKAEIRELLRSWDIPIWDKPAFACLSSRFPYGTKITRENLRRIDRAEHSCMIWEFVNSVCVIMTNLRGLSLIPKTLNTRRPNRFEPRLMKNSNPLAISTSL
jgi:uncharacterized protein